MKVDLIEEVEYEEKTRKLEYDSRFPVGFPKEYRCKSCSVIEEKGTHPDSYDDEIESEFFVEKLHFLRVLSRKEFCDHWKKKSDDWRNEQKRNSDD